MSGASERGFTLLEAAVAIGLTCAVVLGVCGAVLRSLHANAKLAERAVLTDDATNVLADVRAATAYDTGALAQIAGKTSNATIVRAGQTLSVTVTVGNGVGGTPIAAQATVTDANGVTGTASRQLYVEAPAPGAVIDQPSPAASGGPP